MNNTGLYNNQICGTIAMIANHQNHRATETQQETQCNLTIMKHEVNYLVNSISKQDITQGAQDYPAPRRNKERTNGTLFTFKTNANANSDAKNPSQQA